MVSKLHKRAGEERGMALVETAIVLTLLTLLLFGLMEYGWIFHRLQQVNNVARSGARMAVLPDSTSGDATAVMTSMLSDFDITGASTTISPADVTTLVSGELITVTVQVPVENIQLLGFAGVTLPDTLRAEVTMAREGP